MIIVHCSYPPRQIKKMIQQLLGIGAERISKINYSKSYVRKDKKVSLQKESVLLIYCAEDKQSIVIAAIDKQYDDCIYYFIPHSGVHDK